MTWTAIPGYDGWYEINSEGEVRSWKVQGSHNESIAVQPRTLKPGITRGQKHVNLCMGGVAKSISIGKIQRVTFDGEPWERDGRSA